MTTRPHGRVVLGVAIFTTLIAATPTAAVAAPPDPAKLEAVTELKDGELYQKVVYRVRRGEVVPAQLGVISVDAPPVRGLVAEVRAVDDLEFATRYRNCWYTVNGNADIAWCEFDAVLPGYGGLTITDPMVAVEPDARPERVHGIPFRWASKSWADARGGLRKVVDYFKAPGAAVTRGDGGTLTLEQRSLPMADVRAAGNSALVALDESAPTASPSATPTPTPTATGSAAATVSPTASPSAGGDGGGLPVTGGRSDAVAGAGAALLISGIAGFLIARRRRTHFVS